MRVLIALAALVLGGCAGGSGELATLSGGVVVGPTPGPCVRHRPCSGPVADVELVFTRPGRDPVTTRTDERGLYRVSIPPGSYRISVTDYPLPAMLSPMTVTVESDIELDLMIDSGVR